MTKSDPALENGVALIDKPVGISSFGALKKIRKHFGIAKIGHAGTLDPHATGLLLVCLGQATKISQYLMGQAKVYTFTLRFGLITDTLDAQGQVLDTAAHEVTEEALKKVLAQMVGPQQQIPPRYSAIKVQGKKLYEYARAQKEVDVAARSVHFYALSLQSLAKDSAKIKVECSSGTYVRSLARDIAAALGTLGIADDIRRLRIGHFDVKDAIPLAAFLALPELCSIPIAQALSDMPLVKVETHEDVMMLRNGQHIALNARSRQGKDQKDASASVLVVDPSEQAVAIAYIKQNYLFPKRVF